MLVPPIAHAPYRDFIGQIEAIVREKFAALHLDFHRDFFFPAGSMFWFKPPALTPLLGLNLGDDDFSPENDEVDGTLAHVVERLFTVAAEKSGYTCEVIDW